MAKVVYHVLHKKTEETVVLIVRNLSSGNEGVGVHRFMMEAIFVVVW